MLLSRVTNEIIDFNILNDAYDEKMKAIEMTTAKQVTTSNEPVQTYQNQSNDALEHQYIEFKPISAQDFMEIYPSDLINIGETLIDINDEIDFYLNRFMKKQSQETAFLVSNAFNKFSNILADINEFANIHYATKKYAEIFMNLDEKKSYQEYSDVMLFVSFGLIKWCENVLINTTAIDIHYLDKSLLSDVMMIENLFFSQKEESFEEIEFF